MAGDFNQDLNANHYYGSKVGKAALQKALCEAELACVTGGENDPIIKAGFESFANIDHICFNSELAQVREFGRYFQNFGVGTRRKSNGDGGRVVAGRCSEDLLR